MRQVVIKVKGMECTGCENRIKKALEEMRGIDEVKADYRKETVTIEPTGTFDEEDVKEKLEDLGFEVIEIKKEF